MPDIGQTTKDGCGPKTCDYGDSHWPQVACTWLTVESSNKQHKGSGIKNINEGMDAVPNYSLVPCKVLVVKAVFQW